MFLKCEGVILSPSGLGSFPTPFPPLASKGVVCRNMDVDIHVHVNVQSLRASILSIIFCVGRNMIDADKYDKRRD